jgi:hypothetical protein
MPEDHQPQWRATEVRIEPFNEETMNAVATNEDLKITEKTAQREVCLRVRGEWNGAGDHS